jgi:hypothetical protein
LLVLPHIAEQPSHPQTHSLEGRGGDGVAGLSHS